MPLDLALEPKDEVMKGQSHLEWVWGVGPGTRWSQAWVVSGGTLSIKSMLNHICEPSITHPYQIS